MNYTPYGYISFRSNNQTPLGLDYKPTLRKPLMTDVFERTTTGERIAAVNKILAEKYPAICEIKAFSPSKREDERNKIIEKEKAHIAKTITKRTEESKKKLRSAGVKEGDLYKYLTIDGHINSEGKRIINGK